MSLLTQNAPGVEPHLPARQGLLEVQETLLDFPERQSRKLQWTPFEIAVREIFHPQLRDLLLMLPGEIQMGGLLGGSLSE